MSQWVAPGAQSSQAFVDKLGIFGHEDFAALLVCDVETGDDDGRLVPLKVKKAWQRWCLKGHPDRGGEYDAYMAMYQEYEDFKEWFPKRLNHEKYERTVKQKERAADAEKGAIAARADSRLNKATEYATQAIAAYRALHDWYTQEMQPTAMQQAAIDLQRAQGLFDTIRQEAEEAENERREKQEHRDLSSGLNSFFNSVCGIVDGLDITQKFDKLRAFFDEKEKESKAEIVKLVDDTRKQDEKMKEMLVKIESVTRQLRDAKRDCNELQTQWDELIQETSPGNTNLAKAVDWMKSSMGLSSSRRLLTQNIKIQNQETDQLKQEHINLQKDNKLLHEDLQDMQSSQEVYKNEAAAAQKKEAQMETDFNELFQKAHLEKKSSTERTGKSHFEATQSAKQIEQLNNHIEQLQQQCNSTCKQEVVELKSQLVEQAAKHKEEYKKYITDVNPKASSSEQMQESDGAKSSVSGFDPTAYEETSTNVSTSKNILYAT